MLPSSASSSKSNNGSAARRGSGPGLVSDDLANSNNHSNEEDDDETLSEASNAVPPRRKKKQKQPPAQDVEIIVIESSASEDSEDQHPPAAVVQDNNKEESASTVLKKDPAAVAAANLKPPPPSSLAPLPSVSLLDTLIASNQGRLQDNEEEEEEKKEPSVLETLPNARRKTSITTKTIPNSNAFARSYRVENPKAMEAAHASSLKPPAASPPSVKPAAASASRAAATSVQGGPSPLTKHPAAAAAAKAARPTRKRQRSMESNDNPHEQKQTSSVISNMEVHGGVYAYDSSSQRWKKRTIAAVAADSSFSEGYSPDKFRDFDAPEQQHGGQSRRSTRLRQEALRKDAKQERGKWTDSEERVDDMIMIGPHFQCRVPTRLFLDYATTKSSAEAVMMWDPVKAALAASRCELIDEFLSEGTTSLELQMLKMEALHKADYCVAGAKEHWVTLVDTVIDPDIRMRDDEEVLFSQLVQQGDDAESTKRFHEIAQTMGRSLKTILVQYYRWKSRHAASYGALKAKRKGEPDECEVCHDGGNLILCDNCNKAYHWKTCIPTPLEKPPAKDEDWYCNKCVCGTPAKLRRLCNGGGRRLDTSGPSPSSRTTLFSSATSLHREKLRNVHLELLNPPAIIIPQPSNDQFGSGALPGAASEAEMIWDSRLHVFRLVETDVSCRIRHQLFGSQDSDDVEFEGPVLRNDSEPIDEGGDDDDDGTDAESRNSLDLASASSGLSSSDDDELDRKLKPPRKEAPSSPDNSDSSFHNSDISDDDDDSDDEHDEGADNGVKGKPGSATPCVAFSNPKVYTAVVPVGPTGLNVVFSATPGGRTIFKSYDRPTGLMGLAEMKNVFENLHDEVVEVEGMSCTGKSFAEVMNLIRSLVLKLKSQPNTSLRLTMGASRSINSNLMNTSPQPAVASATQSKDLSRDRSLATAGHQHTHTSQNVAHRTQFAIPDREQRDNGMTQLSYRPEARATGTTARPIQTAPVQDNVMGRQQQHRQQQTHATERRTVGPIQTAVTAQYNVVGQQQQQQQTHATETRTARPIQTAAPIGRQQQQQQQPRAMETMTARPIQTAALAQDNVVRRQQQQQQQYDSKVAGQGPAVASELQTAASQKEPTTGTTFSIGRENQQFRASYPVTSQEHEAQQAAHADHPVHVVTIMPHLPEAVSARRDQGDTDQPPRRANEELQGRTNETVPIASQRPHGPQQETGPRVEAVSNVDDSRQAQTQVAQQALALAAILSSQGSRHGNVNAAVSDAAVGATQQLVAAQLFMNGHPLGQTAGVHPREVIAPSASAQDIGIEASMLVAFHDQRNFLLFLLAQNITTSDAFFQLPSEVLASAWAIHLGRLPTDQLVRDFVGAMKFRLHDEIRRRDC